MEPIILASGSARRQEYFKLMGLPFSIMPADIDESNISSTDPIDIACELSILKVRHIVKTLSPRLPKWICGADTVVSIGTAVFGKPKDRDDAESMLRALSGQEHMVVTAMALYNGKENKIDCRSASCMVRFARLSGQEIQWYLDSGEWQEVAGSYRLQGLAGLFITSIHGAPSTVVGLPLHDFYAMLIDNGYPFGV